MNNALLCALGVLIAIVVVVFPFAMMFTIGSDQTSAGSVPSSATGTIIMQTIGWSVFVGLTSTAIGWMLGVRLASVQKSLRLGIIAMLLMTLAVPAYAVFYAWWQVWPSGTWLHGYLVEHSMLGVATGCCLGLALVGWSWPIPALIAMMTTKSTTDLTTLHRLDGASIWLKLKHRIVVDSGAMLSSVLLVAALTAANTTCFDLAQISTIGNELRSTIATGTSIMQVPSLTIVGFAIAVIASIILLRVRPSRTRDADDLHRSCGGILFVWLLLSGGPLVISAIGSLRGGGLQLWKFYAGDMMVSGIVGISVAAVCLVIFITSTWMHLAPSKRIRTLAHVLDFGWIVVAFLPAGLLAAMMTNAWNHEGLDAVYRSTPMLVLAHLTHIGFVGSLQGRWVASNKNLRTLCAVDGVMSPRHFVVAAKPQILSASMVVIGISIAMSLSEVALTSQLSPPSTYQPIAVSLLNAMHYQRPEIVTSALCLIVVVAAIGGLLVYCTHRKFLCGCMLIFLVAGCGVQPEEPINSNASIIGGAGLVDGRFMTPRAIDANEQVIVVIDKSGRLQLFTSAGDHLNTWNLPLSGTGYPTGVSLDQLGLIWVAETHGHRVLVYDLSGNEVLRFGSYGTSDGEFLYPTDIAFGLNGEVYVSEYGGNDRISVFDRAGRFIRSFGHHGEDQAGFMRPQSITVDPQTGNLLIADAGNHRIVVCDVTGKVLRLIAHAGREQGQLLYPYGITFVSPDSFLVCEYGNNRLQQFSVNGTHINAVGSAGDQVGQFKTPWGVAKTPSGIIVADTGNNRLQLLPDMMTTQ